MQTKNAMPCGNVCMTHILPKAVAFGRAMFMLTKPSLSCVPQAQDEPHGKAFFAFLGGVPEMWRRLPRDDRHKTVSVRRGFPFWKETANDPESPGAATRQTEMWRRLPRDDRHKTVPVRRRFSFWKETANDPESLGAATRQACDLEGVGAVARQSSKFKNFYTLNFEQKE
ncbi:hypothetical protein NX023_13360 [Cytobacillus firmus]|nr:hypothetical protein [Cytobacillus firmus]